MKLDGHRQIHHPLSTILTPGAGLFCSIVLIIGTISNLTISGTFTFFLFALFIALWSKDLHKVLLILVPINGFMLIVWITLPLSIPDPSPLVQFSYFSISRVGLKLALILTLKANAAALFFLSLVTNNPHDLGRILQSLKLSDKLIVLFILICQHIGLLRKDFIAALQSLSIRAPKIKGILALKMYAYLVGTVLVHSIDHAEKIRMVLARREKPLVYVFIPHRSWTITDFVASMLTLVMTIGVTVLFNRSA